jgi:arylsulfatase A-like enzyme
VVTEPVSTVDLAPSLLELAGLPPIPGGDGRSWLPLLRGEPALARGAALTIASRRYPGETPAAAVVEGQWFLRRDPGGEAQLYDVDDDPGQRDEVTALHSDIVARLLPALERLQAWTPAPGSAPRPSPALSAEDEAELRALGYVR